MSTLRQVQNTENNPFLEGDVEAQKKDGGDGGASSSSSTPAKPAATAFATASSTDAFSGASASGGGSTQNPVLLAQIILRKVAVLLAASDEEDISRPGGIITLFKDVILGIILGVFTISFLIFLDHRDVIHFQSAHNFRNAAFQLLNDPETIANVEESSDLKFMTITDYERKRKEIDSVSDKIAESRTVLEKRTTEAEEKRKEVESLKDEHASLMKNPALGLDEYCGGCVWGNRITCDGRVQFLKDTYNTRPIEAMVSVMSRPSCHKVA